MKPKKSKKANLERYKKLFFEIGLVLTLGFVLLAFEWGTTPKEYQEPDLRDNYSGLQEIIPVTTHPEKKVAPPPPVPPEVIEIVKDEVLVKGDEFKPGPSEINIDDPVNYDLFDESGEEPEEDVIPYYNLKAKPTFNGKDLDAFRKYVQRKSYYPVPVQEAGIEGIVYVQFVIDTDGNITNIEVLRTPDPALAELVVDIIKNSKGWEPGKQGTRAVPVIISIPVKFRLAN